MQRVLFRLTVKLCHVTNTVSQNTVGLRLTVQEKNTVHNPCFSLVSTTLQHVQTLCPPATPPAEEGSHYCVSYVQLEFCLK